MLNPHTANVRMDPAIGVGCAGSIQQLTSSGCVSCTVERRFRCCVAVEKRVMTSSNSENFLCHVPKK
jgi:hypothetical protein